MKKTIARIFLLLLILCGARLCFISEPLGVSVDESTYLSLAEILDQGGVFYKNAVDRKPVGVIWLYELIGKIFGFWNIHGVHLVFFLILIALVICAYQVSLRLFYSQRIAWVAAFTFALSSSSFPREILSANAEMPMLLCVSIGLLFFLKSKQGMNLFLFAVFSSFAILFKQYAVLISLGAFLGWLIFKWRFQGRHILRESLKIISISFLAASLVLGFVSYLFWRERAFGEFLDYFLLDGMKYVAKSREVSNHQTSGVFATLAMIASWPVLWWGLVFQLKTPKSLDKYIVVGASFGALFTIYLSGRYYTHYFLPLAFFLSVLVSKFIFDFLSTAQKKWRVVMLMGLVAPYLVFAWFNFYREVVTTTWAFTQEKQLDISILGAWIQQRTTPQDRIVVWGMASQIYLTSQRGSGSRYVFSDFISGRQPGFKSPESVPTPGALELFLSDLKLNRPRVFIDTSSAAINDYQWFPPTRIAELSNFLEANYRREARIQNFEVWILKN